MTQWLQITAGRGPVECQWVVGQVMEAFCKEANPQGIKTTLLEAVSGEAPQTYHSVLLGLSGSQEILGPLLATWVGTIQWVGKSPFRKNHKRRNWYVGVESLVVEDKPKWSPTEVEFTTMRSSGPGGQHVNKTESAVRVVHKPTGLRASAREERSQEQNRRLALARLAALFAQGIEQKQQEAERVRWDQHNDLVRGNPVRVYLDQGKAGAFCRDDSR